MRIDNVDSFRGKLEIKATPHKVFSALTTDIGGWWGKQDKPIQHRGDVFTISWNGPWYKFEVIEYRKNECIVWKCIDSLQIIENLDGVEKEWVGTQIEWSIMELDGNEIALSFHHNGLRPHFICYDFCTSTWDRILTNNLKSFLES